jgi:nucleoside phosphorylase
MCCCLLLPSLTAIACYNLLPPPTQSSSLYVSRSCGKRYLLTAMAKNHQYTIGWICSLPLEKEAARLVLDEEYLQEEVQYQNTYYLGGRIGKHKVVMGVQRRIGLSQTAILAEKMHAGFPNIGYFLLVGIAGGVPCYGPAGATSKIVLGDVVVSSP